MFLSSSVLNQLMNSGFNGYFLKPDFLHSITSSTDNGHILFSESTFSVSYFLNFLRNLIFLALLYPVRSAAFELSIPFSVFTPSENIRTPLSISEKSLLSLSTIAHPMELVPKSNPNIFVIIIFLLEFRKLRCK